MDSVGRAVSTSSVSSPPTAYNDRAQYDGHLVQLDHNNGSNSAKCDATKDSEILRNQEEEVEPERHHNNSVMEQLLESPPTPLCDYIVQQTCAVTVPLVELELIVTGQLGQEDNPVNTLRSRPTRPANVESSLV